MNPPNQGTSSSADPPLKRKRGRPRKDESLIQGENTPLMPGSESSDSTRKSQQSVDTSGTVGSGAVGGGMVGQIVSGVIEGTFDAGYLLKVKLGDTDTYLRGLVFLPGRFTPITNANDVAPQAKMYKRIDMPIPVPNPPTQLPGSVSLSVKSDRQPVELKKLALAVQDQGLPSELQFTDPIAQEKQSASAMLPATNNLPMNGTGSSLQGKAILHQSLESGVENQSAHVVAQMEHDKVAEQDEVLLEFEASITKGPNVNVEATDQLKSVPQSAPSIDVLPGTETVNLELQIQHQAAGHELKPNQLVHGGMRNPSCEHYQAPLIAEPGSMSSEPVGINNWMEKQASPQKAAPTELAIKILSGDDTSYLNGRPVNQAANTTRMQLQSAPITSLPAMLFEREAIPCAPKLSADGSLLQRMIEPQTCSSSGATNIMKADTDPAPMTSLPVTLFGREAIPSESKGATDVPILPKVTEPQFCSSSGAANKVDCNVKDAIPPTES